ncbi:hypothetical protein BATDEDRAFT_27661 [Batrachochytrium dendrobatidis JAM81]|uniref:Exosome complex protein n=1 Tax=Batrachochytrium dendrobatidis (strain JAM81 / FGSC 10211) TaxID=684364 RepID=F4PBJ4_BATDJ|nr:uncharacterized protein BATDEDRAFT_27661 [Batrachochytrium dendrobatidis JAM81]EGF77457.1 hypothetical protein BATDEDRAFT_27661 [Batrachochytrium dendrobatidis JAM81]|eukprot:XP_006681930.1 hypothetical protein BATDEDRAFT_27661 [Batrachochytrium dendrobatidis JAM81]
MATEKAEQLLDQMVATQKALSAILDTSLESTLGNLEAVEKARLLTTLSYTINTLSFVYLKLQGVNAKTHPVKKELASILNAFALFFDRTRIYFEKIEKMAGATRNPASIDRDAAKRFLQHSLAQNPEVKDGIAKARKANALVDLHTSSQADDTQDISTVTDATDASVKGHENKGNE